MSVNIYQNGTLTPIAGKTVPAPTPDYVDEQFNSAKTYSKGMTCIEGNVRYRYKNSTATSGHRPPNTTYWEVLSVSDEIKNPYTSYTNKGSLTVDTTNNRYIGKSASDIVGHKAFAVITTGGNIYMQNFDMTLINYIKTTILSSTEWKNILIYPFKLVNLDFALYTPVTPTAGSLYVFD